MRLISSSAVSGTCLKTCPLWGLLRSRPLCDRRRHAGRMVIYSLCGGANMSPKLSAPAHSSTIYNSGNYWAPFQSKMWYQPPLYTRNVELIAVLVVECQSAKYRLDYHNAKFCGCIWKQWKHPGNHIWQANARSPYCHGSLLVLCDSWHCVTKWRVIWLTRLRIWTRVRPNSAEI